MSDNSFFYIVIGVLDIEHDAVTDNRNTGIIQHYFL